MFTFYCKYTASVRSSASVTFPVLKGKIGIRVDITQSQSPYILVYFYETSNNILSRFFSIHKETILRQNISVRGHILVIPVKPGVSSAMSFHLVIHVLPAKSSEHSHVKKKKNVRARKRKTERFFPPL